MRSANDQNGKKKFLDRIKTFGLMNLGSVLMAAGVYFFKIPNGFSTGGVSGIATILGKVIPAEFITPSKLIVIINALLLAVGFLILGKNAIINTVYCSLEFSLLTYVFELVFPMSGPLTDQPTLELVYAIILTGLGSAVLFSSGSSSGGTDIVALILKKYTSLDVGKALLCTDFLIASSSFIVYGVEVGLFSLAGLFAKAFLVDGIIENMSVCKSFMIITDKPKEIEEYIINEMHHSATEIEAVGAYTGENKKVVVTLCKRVEGAKLKQKIAEIDKKAFVIVHSTTEFIGKGFRQI